MTTATVTDRNTTSLESLVGWLIDALRWNPAPTQGTRLARNIHEARRLRQSGDLDGALAALGSVDTATTSPEEVRWAHSEWLDLVRRRFGDREVLVYSPDWGRAAALTPRVDSMLEVVAVLGMAWQSGKAVSRRSLRGLRPLNGAGHGRRR